MSKSLRHDPFLAIAAATKEFKANLQSIREEIGAKKEERARIAALPPDIPHIEKRVDEWLQVQLNDVVGDLSHEFLFPEARYRRNGTPDLIRGFEYKVRRYLARFVADQVKAECREQLMEMESIAEDVRSHELEKLDSEIAGLEHGEEKIIRQAEAAGLMAPRRKDASPAALLAPDEDDAVVLTEAQHEHFEAVTGR